MSATAKGRPTASRRPPSTSWPASDGEEVIDISAEPEGEPERVLLFRIGGVEYTMLKNPPPSIGLAALDLADRRGGSPQSVALADVYVMREMLGEESYRALLNCKTMDRDQYLRIVGRVMRSAMGAIEDEDGSPNR